MPTVRLNREDCIGCSACAGICPSFWAMNNEDNKTDLKGAEKAQDGWFELEVEERDLECNRQAEDVCPVDVIKVIQ
ncbi:MAG: ferredoxin [Candidatus Altiarchaeales archaeon]|nr:ferredoxin [Candidatus Altiarchaeales archaeon]